MDLSHAKTLFETEMHQHGLVQRGWKHRFDEANKQFGSCQITKKIISLSRPLVVLNSEEEVRDTILHEIAHALAWERHGENCHHDHRWKAICREIGARPEATYDDEVVRPDLPWLLRHVETGEVFASYQRKPSGNPASIFIRGRVKQTLGKLEYARNPECFQPGQIERFDRNLATEFQREAEAALKALSEKWGVELDKTSGQFGIGELLLEFRFIPPRSADGKSPEEREFASLAPLFNLTEEDYGRFFFQNQKPFQLIGIKPKNRKYPIIGRAPNGAHYKFPPEVLDNLHR
jgi:predicted SprT family Zn-dependent metalloprotease